MTKTNGHNPDWNGREAHLNTGRRTRLTDDREKTICDALRMGNYFNVSCELAGVDPDIGLEWVRRGEGRHPTRPPWSRDDDPTNPDTWRYARFARAVTLASAEAETHAVAVVRKAMMRGDRDAWRPAIEFLRRRSPDRWGDKLDTHVEHSGTVRLEAPSQDELRALGDDNALLELDAVELPDDDEEG